MNFVSLSVTIIKKDFDLDVSFQWPGGTVMNLNPIQYGGGGGIMAPLQFFLNISRMT